MVHLKIFFLFLVLICTIQAKLSDLRLCANEDCTELISRAKTSLLYIAPEKGILSFPKNIEIKIFSKSAGTRPELWGAEINGKRGYIPKSSVQETTILKKNLKFIVPTETFDDSSKSPIPLERIVPNSVTPPYQIVEGTTIYPEAPNFNTGNQEITSSNNVVITDHIQQSEGVHKENNVEPTLSMSPVPQAVYKNTNTAQTINAPQNIEEVHNVSTGTEDNKESGKTSINTEEERESEISHIDNSINKENLNTAQTDNASQKLKDVHKSVSTGIEGNKISEETSKGTNILPIYTEEKKKSEIKHLENAINTQENIEETFKNSGDNHIDTVTEEKTDAKHNIENRKSNIFHESEDKEIREPEEKEVAEESSVVSKIRDYLFKDAERSAEYDENEEDDEDDKDEDDKDADDEEGQKTIESENKLTFTSESDQIKHDPHPLVGKSFDSATTHIIENNAPETPTDAENNVSETDSNENLKANLPNVQEVKNILENGSNDNTKEKQTELVDKSNIETVTNKDVPKEDLEEAKKLEVKEKKVVFGVLQHLPSTFSVPIKHGNINSSPTETLEKVPENVTVIEPSTTDTNVHFTTELPLQEIPLSVTEVTTQAIIENSPTVQELEVKDKPINNETNFNISAENYSDTNNYIESENLVPPNKMDKNLKETKEDTSLFTKMYSGMFGSAEELTKKHISSKDIPTEFTDDSENQEEQSVLIEARSTPIAEQSPFDKYLPDTKKNTESSNYIFNDMGTCERGENSESCKGHSENNIPEPVIATKKVNEYDWLMMEFSENASRIMMYFVLASVSVLIFSLSYYFLEKTRIDGTLVCKINALEKKLLITSKENLLFEDELKQTKERLVSIEDSSFGSDEMVTILKQDLEEEKNIRSELEEQIANLEKELEAATEAGMEMNKMLSEICSSQHGNENLMQNVEHLQKQLIEQQTTINNINSTLGNKNTENELLQTELSVANDKIEQFQADMDKMVVNLLTVQEEKVKIETELEEQSKNLKEEYIGKLKLINTDMSILKEENNRLKQSYEDIQHDLELKNNEYCVLKESMSEMQAINSNKESLKALLDVSKVKAEVQQLRDQKHIMTAKLQSEQDSKLLLEKQIQIVMQEMKILKDKFEEADKEKVEAQTRLDVLSTYFKEKETQLQKEINEHESMWVQKQGEASSTVERIKWIQEELQNYKSQNELLKKEILDQGVSLKSQLSLLEKKAHENWVLARQAERKLEDTKQEASQLRNRLTIVEKNNNSSQLDENKLQSRLMQTMEANGDIAVSPLHMSGVEGPGSPPLLYSHRDHLTTSPPLPPFMPPPPGVPFMPPPMPGVPPFMPPPPALFPGDHRPPPLGRMSSPPLHGRYSPDSRAYSPYDRDDSPPMSPTYADSDYRRGRSPPPPHGPRTFSPYSGKGRSQWDDIRDYRERPQQSRMKSRGHKGTAMSSGSGNSNESLDNSGRHSGRV